MPTRSSGSASACTIASGEEHRSVGAPRHSSRRSPRRAVSTTARDLYPEHFACRALRGRLCVSWDRGNQTAALEQVGAVAGAAGRCRCVVGRAGRGASREQGVLLRIVAGAIVTPRSRVRRRPPRDDVCPRRRPGWSRPCLLAGRGVPPQYASACRLCRVERWPALPDRAPGRGARAAGRRRRRSMLSTAGSSLAGRRALSGRLQGSRPESAWDADHFCLGSAWFPPSSAATFDRTRSRVSRAAAGPEHGRPLTVVRDRTGALGACRAPIGLGVDAHALVGGVPLVLAVCYRRTRAVSPAIRTAT